MDVTQAHTPMAEDLLDTAENPNTLVRALNSINQLNSLDVNWLC